MKASGLRKEKDTINASMQRVQKENADLEKGADQALLLRAKTAEEAKKRASIANRELLIKRLEANREERRQQVEGRAKKKLLKSATLMFAFGTAELYDIGTDTDSFVAFANNVTGACPEGEPEACETLYPIFAAFFAAFFAFFFFFFTRLFRVFDFMASFRLQFKPG